MLGALPKKVANTLILFGAILLVSAFVFKLSANSAPTENEIITPVKEVAKPTELESISIPAIDINLPISKTWIRDGNWEIKKDTVSHLQVDGPLREKGTIVLYAHNSPEMFGEISTLKKGVAIELVTKTKEIKKFRVSETEIVYPRQIEVLFEGPKDTLILYTCYGSFDSQRFVVKASPSETEKR